MKLAINSLFRVKKELLWISLPGSVVMKAYSIAQKTDFIENRFVTKIKQAVLNIPKVTL